MKPTLVLIPGLLSDERVWAPLSNATSRPVLNATTTLDDTIEAMAQRVLSDTNGPLIVVGHSMGARVAMETARQSPDRVVSLVLANTGHKPLGQGELVKRQSKITQGHSNFPEMVAAWLPPMVAANRHDDISLMQDLTAMALSMGPVVHEQQIKALITRPDAGASLPQISCPVLLMTGTEDIWSPEPQHREIAELVPDATLYVVEDAGHFLPVEQPARCTQLIQSWIAEHTGLDGIY